MNELFSPTGLASHVCTCEDDDDQDDAKTVAVRSIFTSQKKSPRPGQNSVLKIDWTGANFSTK